MSVHLLFGEDRPTSDVLPEQIVVKTILLHPALRFGLAVILTTAKVTRTLARLPLPGRVASPMVFAPVSARARGHVPRRGGMFPVFDAIGFDLIRDQVRRSPDKRELLAPLGRSLDSLWADMWRVQAEFEHDPPTLCHGDAHIGNTYLLGDQAGLLDWQLIAVAICSPQTCHPWGPVPPPAATSEGAFADRTSFALPRRKHHVPVHAVAERAILLCDGGDLVFGHRAGLPVDLGRATRGSGALPKAPPHGSTRWRCANEQALADRAYACTARLWKRPLSGSPRPGRCSSVTYSRKI